jgi:hypothetical protein
VIWVAAAAACVRPIRDPFGATGTVLAQNGGTNAKNSIQSPQMGLYGRMNAKNRIQSPKWRCTGGMNAKNRIQSPKWRCTGGTNAKNSIQSPNGPSDAKKSQWT